MLRECNNNTHEFLRKLASFLHGLSAVPRSVIRQGAD